MTKTLLYNSNPSVNNADWQLIIPNDSIEKAGSNLIYYRNLLADKGEKLDISKLDTKNIKETSIAIRDIKDRLFNLKEKEFANDQKNKTEDFTTSLLVKS